MGLVKFQRLTVSEYEAARKDADTLYFVPVSDARGTVSGYRMCLGDKPIVTSAQ